MSFKGAALLVYNIYIYIYFSTLVNFKQSLLSKTRSLDNAIQEFKSFHCLGLGLAIMSYKPLYHAIQSVFVHCCILFVITNKS